MRRWLRRNKSDDDCSSDSGKEDGDCEKEASPAYDGEAPRLLLRPDEAHRSLCWSLATYYPSCSACPEDYRFVGASFTSDPISVRDARTGEVVATLNPAPVDENGRTQASRDGVWSLVTYAIPPEGQPRIASV
jgi:hypothetical protein